MPPTDEVVDATAEVPLVDWSPRTPPRGSAVTGPDAVAFVDGVRRVDARVWVTGDDGEVRQGICATWAAGVVRCCGPEAHLVSAEVRRGLFSPAGADSVGTRHGTWVHRPAASDDPDQLAIALQNAMADLEHRVSEQAGLTSAPPDLLLVDGPLRERARIGGAVGYVKTHQRSYLVERNGGGHRRSGRRSADPGPADRGPVQPLVLVCPAAGRGRSPVGRGRALRGVHVSPAMRCARTG